MSFFPLPLPGRVHPPHVNPLAPLPAFNPPTFDQLSSNAMAQAGTTPNPTPSGGGMNMNALMSALPLLANALGGQAVPPPPAPPAPRPVDNNLLAQALGNTNQGNIGVPGLRR